MAAASLYSCRSRNIARSPSAARDLGGVARIVVVTDRQSDVVKRSQWVAGFGLGPGQCHGQICLVGSIAALLCDRQASPQGIECSKWLFLAPRHAVGE